jgi:hypothetical protein
MKKIIFIGFDIEGVGGISTYSRYQIKALKEKYPNQVYVYSLLSLEKEYNGFVDETISYQNKLTLFKLIKNVQDIELIVFNHVNLSFIGAMLTGHKDGSYEPISDIYPNGFRVSPRNIDEIADKIQFYIDNPEMKKEHGKNGRKFVIEEFEYSKFQNKQTAIINKVLQND